MKRFYCECNMKSSLKVLKIFGTPNASSENFNVGAANQGELLLCISEFD